MEFIIERKIIIIIIILVNLMMIIYNILSHLFKFKKLNVTSIITVNIIIVLMYVSSNIEITIIIDKDILINEYLPKTITLIIVIITLKFLNYLKKFPKTLFFIFLLELLAFIYFIMFNRINEQGIAILIITLYSLFILFKQFLPLTINFETKKFFIKLGDNIYDFIYKNQILNKFFFLRNYMIMLFCNMNMNNPISYIIYSIFGLLIFPYLVYNMQYQICMYIAILISIFLFINDILMIKYKKNNKFHNNFNQNVTDCSKLIYTITRQTKPINLKIIKRNMVKIAIDGIGYIETGPIPHKTAKMLAATAVITGMLAGGVYVIDSNNKTKVEITKYNSESERYKAETAKSQENIAKAIKEQKGIFRKWF